ncbi:MAG TPA: ABC transporter permease, partial [Candidatus Saccharimonadia bacterium]|nr:ABC transporter permease [Candidatus Saccharimonadia bacterium]
MLTSIFRAFRSLARTPGFALVAILTLGLALGAIGTVFAVVNAVLLKPLPYPGSERIIRIVGSQGACTDCPVARPVLFDWQEQTTEAFESLGAFAGTSATLTGGEGAEKLEAYTVTPEFWRVMAVPAQLGRAFTADEDRAARDVVVISNALWQRAFGGARDVIGRKIVLNGEPHEIVGVMPEHFKYPGGDAWLPTQLASATTGRDTNYLSVVARLREGVALEQAERLMA